MGSVTDPKILLGVTTREFGGVGGGDWRLQQLHMMTVQRVMRLRRSCR